MILTSNKAEDQHVLLKIVIEADTWQSIGRDIHFEGSSGYIEQV